jgi:hypothetical protein
MNAKLLREVKKRILEEPRRFSMGTWGSTVSKRVAPCGTVACLAGHAVAISKPTHFVRYLHAMESSIYSLAIKSLSISVDQADRLFYVSGWPQEFKEGYVKATTRKQMAGVAAKRIDHFIRTGK